MPPGHRGRRYRRLRARDRRLSAGGKALAARARTGGGRVRAHALDAFCDALWLEDGLAQNTIAAYRADLAQFESFLGRDPVDAAERELFAFLARKAGRASSAARRVSSLKRFYQHCVRERLIDARPP